MSTDLTPLPDLAARINHEHDQAEAAFRSGLLHARAAGELLLEAKGQLQHGKWLPWLKENVRFSERTAQAYMRVAKGWPALEAKAQRVADLPFRDAVKLLAAPEEVPAAEATDEPGGFDARAYIAAALTKAGSPPDPALIPDEGRSLIFLHGNDRLFIEPGGGAHYFVTVLRTFGVEKEGHVEGGRHPVLGVAVPFVVRRLGAESLVALGERKQVPAFSPAVTYNRLLFGNEGRVREEAAGEGPR
jgi:hypothetical protein